MPFTPPNNPGEPPRPIFLTPDLRDSIFYTWSPATIPRPDEYGQRFHDSTRYPDHVLVYVSDEVQREETGGDAWWRKWFWTAKRKDQHKYNKEIDYPVNGRKKFPRITRTTIELRAEYTSDLTVPAMGTADVEYATALLSVEAMRRVPDKELDSLFVAVVREFHTIPDLDTPGDVTELGKFGYRVDFPFGDQRYPRLTWQLPTKLDDFTRIAVGTACPINATATGGADYTALLLANESSVPTNDGANKSIVTRVYETVPGPTLDTVTKRNPMGIPEAFIVSSTLTRSTVRNNATGVIPTTPSGDPVDSEVVIESVTLPEGQSRYLYQKTNTLWSIVVGPLVSQNIDQDTGGLITTTRTLVDKGATGSAVNDDGEYTNVRESGQYKDIEVASKVTDLAGNPKTWDTTVYYPWPKVLVAAFVLPIYKYLERGNTDDIYTHGYSLNLEYKTYKGPARATKTLSWSKDPPVYEAYEGLMPKAASWAFARFGGTIDECLHDSLLISEEIFAGDPEYPPQAFTRVFEATNETDWPNSFVANIEVVEAKGGGYHKLKTVIYSPDGTSGGAKA